MDFFPEVFWKYSLIFFLFFQDWCFKLFVSKSKTLQKYKDSVLKKVTLKIVFHNK